MLIVNNEDFYKYVISKIKESVNDITIINTDTYMKALDLVQLLSNSESTKKYIINSEDIENIFQYKFKYEYKSFLIRGFIDIIHINHKLKTIQLIDLKTGSDYSSKFMNNFLKYKYYLQFVIYQNAIKSIMSKYNIEDYKINNFGFMYIGRSEKIPVIYTLTKKWEKSAINGFKTNLGYKYKGLHQLLDEIKWHYENDEFSANKEMIDNKFNLILDDNIIEDE